MKREQTTLVLALLPALLSACGQHGEDDSSQAYLTADTLGEQQVRSTTDYLRDPKYAKADLANGEKQAAYCRACHSLEAGGANMVGPPLHGFFGQTAGTRGGFAYSQALAEAQLVWTPTALDAWLAQPARFLPGNRMIFAGVARQSDRDDLIAYLLDVTNTDAPETR